MTDKPLYWTVVEVVKYRRETTGYLHDRYGAIISDGVQRIAACNNHSDLWTARRCGEYSALLRNESLAIEMPLHAFVQEQI